MLLEGDEGKYVFMASEKGYGKRTEIFFYRKTRRGGKGLINLKVTPKIGPAVAVPGVAEHDLLIVTVSGKVIRIQTKQVRTSGRATQGVGLINLENGVEICNEHSLSRIMKNCRFSVNGEFAKSFSYNHSSCVMKAIC